MALWILGILVVVTIGAAIALQIAISRNGPAVLDTVDRITGGARDVALLESTNYGDAASQKMRVYGPKRESSDTARPVIMFVHGGSWASGDPDNYGFVARALVPKGFVTVLAGYRLYPDAVYPDMLEDTAKAIMWTRDNIARHGGDPDNIILVGHSAGAYNVVMTALDQQWLAAEGMLFDEQENGRINGPITGVIGLSGPYDFFPFDSDSTKNSFGNASDPKSTQPVNVVRGDAPPMLFIHGEKDTTVLKRNTIELNKRITAAGGSVNVHYFPEMDHVKPLMAIASPYRRDPTIIDLIVEFSRNKKTSVPVQDETR